MTSIRNPSRRAVLAGGAAALALGSGLGPARAQWKPTRDMRILNGFAAGGAGDMLCRIMADALGPIFGRSVIVDTRTGANGFIAADVVASGAPDGHSATLVTMSMMTVAPQLPGMTVPFNVQTDLTPLGSLAKIYVIAVVPPNSPYHSIEDLVKAAKAKPGTLNFGSAGIGSAPHLAGELFNSLAGTKLVHIPYRGGAAAMVEVMAGRLDLIIGNMPDFLGSITQGKLRALAFAGSEAAPQLPNIPLISATVPGYQVENWFGFAGPKNLPPEIARAWTDAMVKALADPAVRKRLDQAGLARLSGTADEMRKLVADDRARWGKVIADANIRVQ